MKTQGIGQSVSAAVHAAKAEAKASGAKVGPAVSAAAHAAKAPAPVVTPTEPTVPEAPVTEVPVAQPPVTEAPAESGAVVDLLV